MESFHIHRRKTRVMHRIQQLVARGYTCYTCGEVRADRAQKLVERFVENYQVSATESQRRYAKQQGRARAYLLLYPLKGEEIFLWWLLVTDGSGAVHERESLHRVTESSSRLNWHGDYELVVLNRPGKTAPVVTWRMTRKSYAAWHDRIRTAVRDRRSNILVRQAIWSLFRAPGFSEVRKQVKALAKIFQPDGLSMQR